MTTIKLSNKCKINISTEAEKNALLMLLEGKLSAIKFWDTYIVVYSNAVGNPDIIISSKRIRVKIKYTNILLNTHEEEDVFLDIRSIKDQLEEADFVNNSDGDYAYIDWDMTLLTITTNESSDYSYRIRLRIHEIPELSSIYTEIANTVYPDIENIGYNEYGNFEAIITGITGIKAKVFINPNQLLDSYAIQM